MGFSRRRKKKGFFKKFKKAITKRIKSYGSSRGGVRL